MRLSFVRFLLKRGTQAEFLRFLASAQPGRTDTAAQDVYGLSLSALDEAWRHSLAGAAPKVKAGQFLRLAVRYLRPYWVRETEMFVHMLLGLAFTLIFPFVFKRLLDTAIPSGEMSEVIKVLGFPRRGARRFARRRCAARLPVGLREWSGRTTGAHRDVRPPAVSVTRMVPAA